MIAARSACNKKHDAENQICCNDGEISKDIHSDGRNAGNQIILIVYIWDIAVPVGETKKTIVALSKITSIGWRGISQVKCKRNRSNNTKKNCDFFTKSLHIVK